MTQNISNPKRFLKARQFKYVIFLFLWIGNCPEAIAYDDPSLSSSLSEADHSVSSANLRYSDSLPVFPIESDEFQHADISLPDGVIESTVSSDHLGEIIENPSSEHGLGQLTHVHQLSDVSPEDWAFGAIVSLNERYGCLAGYPDGQWRGDRPLRRDEFAAAVHACLERFGQLQQELIAFPEDDLETIQQLMSSFSNDLDSLAQRQQSLDSRLLLLESNQFSTTSRMTGQAVFAINAGTFDGDTLLDPLGNEFVQANTNTTLIYRVALDINTSFVGSDLLKIRLDVGSGGANDNVAAVLEPNFGSGLDFSAKPPSDGDLGLGRLFYTFRPTDDITVSLGPSIRTTDYVDTNPYANLSFRDFSTQAFTNNLLLFPVNGPSAGAFVEWSPGDGTIALRGLYAAADASNPGNDSPLRGTASFTRLLYPTTQFSSLGDRGLFGDTYQQTVELDYSPSTDFSLGLQYSRGEVFDHSFQAIGANLSMTIAESLGLFGRYGYGDYEDTQFGDLSPHYWMAGIAVQDLLVQGSSMGFAIGQPFIESNIGNATQTNFEIFYNLPINDRIQITPTLQLVTHPSNQESNGAIFTGTLRTVLLF